MQNYLIKNIHVVNEGSIKTTDVLITNGRIEKISPQITQKYSDQIEINGEGKYLFCLLYTSIHLYRKKKDVVFCLYRATRNYSNSLQFVLRLKMWN